MNVEQVHPVRGLSAVVAALAYHAHAESVGRGVHDGRAHAAAGGFAAHDQRVDALQLQVVQQGSAHEGAGADLADHQFAIARRHVLDDLVAYRANVLRQARQAVAVTLAALGHPQWVGGETRQGLHVHHGDLCSARSGEQLLHLRDGFPALAAAAHGPVLDGVHQVHRLVADRGIVHVDQQQRRALAHGVGVFLAPDREMLAIALAEETVPAHALIPP